MLGEPFEARPELGASAAYRVKRDPLPCFERFDLMHHRVKVENIDALRSLAFEDRTDLSLKEPQLPGVHGSGTVDCDCDLADTLPDHSGR